MTEDPVAYVSAADPDPNGLASLTSQMREEIRQVILGQDVVIDEVITAFLAGPS